MKVIGQYKNGNYAVMLFDDGTKIRANDLDVFLPDKPESMDLCITKACDRGCPMCFSAGTKILMADYSYKNIEDVKVGDQIIGFEEHPSRHKREMFVTTVLKTFQHVEDELVTITSSSGKTITATPNHPFLSSGTGKNHLRSFNKIGNLKLNSNVYEYGFPDDVIDPQSKEYMLGYTIGSWVGDGVMFKGVDKNGYDVYNCRFVTLDEEINDRVFETTSAFVPGFYRLDFTMSGKGHRVRSSVRSNSKQCYDDLKALIDAHIGINTSREYAAGYLSGFCDSAGHVDNQRGIIRLFNTNLVYITEVERCCDLLSIRYVREVRKSGKSKWKDVYVVRPIGEYAVSEFLWYTRPVCKRKSLENYMSFCKQYHATQIIDKQSTIQKQFVYNLETECHTYIANNFLVHNCHEAAKPDGAHGDIMHLPFLDSLLPYTEIAIGGGNPLTHPQLFHFLVKLRDMKMIANMTVHQDHFVQNQALLRWLTGRGLIKGLGVSVTKVNDALLSALAEFPNAVVHIINGVIEMDELKKLYDHNLKLLILGYKDFRRGVTAHTEETDKRKEQLYELLPELKQHFTVVSFDNLAIRQLDVQRLLSKDEWDRFYMGGDGQFTMYVDSVNMEYAVSSVSMERWPVTDDIQEMFERVRSVSLS